MMTSSKALGSPFQRLKQNINRAHGYLRRKEYPKAIEAAKAAFELKPHCNLFGKEKFELEFMLEEFCTTFSANPGIIKFLESIKIRVQPFLTYTPGQEQHVIQKLDIVGLRLEDKIREAEEKRHRAQNEQKKQWLEKGQACLDKGEAPRGKAYLRRVVDEYGHREGVITDVAKRMIGKDLLAEAVELLEEAMQRFDNDHLAYTLATQTYTELREFEKAEDVYMRAIKRFGAHPQTYLNLARLYEMWRKKDKAWDFAKQALDGDPTLDEAREIMRNNE